MKLNIVDLDGSVAAQPPVAARLGNGRARIIDLRDQGPSLRVIASRRGIAEFIARLDRDFGKPDPNQPEVTFYGSGDFHHLTAALLDRLAEPVTVIHFDNHPDWCRFPATFNCGAWVNRALDLPHVVRVVTLGPAGTDLVKPEWQSANLTALGAGRLEVYPWQAAPSRVWWRYPDTPCSRYDSGHIHWRALAHVAWDDFLADLIDRLPRTAVWITIDKDVLAPTEATTNWDQGQMPLDHLIQAVERFAATRRIAGIDICGDYSPPLFRGRMRSTIARFDNPPGPAPSAAALAINATTNARLIDAFERILR